MMMPKKEGMSIGVKLEERDEVNTRIQSDDLLIEKLKCDNPNVNFVPDLQEDDYLNLN